MLTRIVRMEFRPDAVAEFLAHFQTVKHHIRNFPGCERLTLQRDATHANVFYTLSHWASESHLNAYRESELFQSTWAFTKARFAARPQAFSLELAEEVA